MADWEMLSCLDMKLHTELVVDASPRGLGAILTQKTDGEISIIEYGSRALTDAESRYSQTEREVLPICWGCEHFIHYNEGSEFVIVTYYKPLEGT